MCSSSNYAIGDSPGNRAELTNWPLRMSLDRVVNLARFGGVPAIA